MGHTRGDELNDRALRLELEADQHNGGFGFGPSEEDIVIRDKALSEAARLRDKAANMTDNERFMRYVPEEHEASDR